MKHSKAIDYVSQKIRLLIAEDHPKFRKSVKALFQQESDIEVVGEATNGRDAVRLSHLIHPDVIVMDVAMPKLNGHQATKQIVEESPATRVLILSANTEPEYILQAMLVGASGYLIKHSPTLNLVQAVREVVKGKTYFSPSISKLVCDHGRQVFDELKSAKKVRRFAKATVL